MGKLRELMFQAVYGKRMAAFDGIPGPKPTLPLGTSGELIPTTETQPWETLAGYREKYGPMSLIWMMGTPAIVLNDADLIGDVLVDNHAAYYKDAPRQALLPIITASSPFLANEPEWKQMREDNPMAMEGIVDWLKTRVPVLRDFISSRVKSFISSNETLDLVSSIQRLSFDTFVVAAFGKETGDQNYRDFVTMGKMGTRRMQLPLPLPPLNPFFHIARSRWVNTYEELIADAKKHSDPNANDLLSVWLRRGTQLSNASFRDEMANGTFGGVFSVSSGIITALYLINKHKAVADRLREESKRLINDDNFDFTNWEDTTYLDCVLREALRFYAPVPLYFRNVLKSKSTKLGGHELPPNTMVLITNWAVHRSAEHWQDPDKFDPSRWENGGVEANPIGSPYFFPFGRGPRMCLGMPFAMYYMKLALATILSQSHVEISDSQPYRQTFSFGVMMPVGLTGRFESV